MKGCAATMKKEALSEGMKPGHFFVLVGKAPSSTHITCAASLANAANGTLLLRRIFPNACHAYPLSPLPTKAPRALA